MRIGVIGWYGHGNAGDERILASLRCIFAGHDLVVVNNLHLPEAALDNLNACDFVLFGGGGLLLRGSGVYAARFAKLTAPLGVIGISVEAVHADNRALLDLLREKAAFIHVRDAESARVFAGVPRLLSGVDLTFFDPYDVVAPPADPVAGLNLRPWRYWRAEHGSATDRLWQRVDRRLPGLRRVYPFAKWMPERVVDALHTAGWGLHPLSFYDEAGEVTDADALAPFFTAVPRFAADAMDRCRLVVGMRLHALIFACQKGLPFVSLTYQPKNAAFCAAVGVSALSADLYHPAAFTAALAQVDAYDALRARLLAYRAEAHARMREDAATIRAWMGCTA
jgi:polysaccharide pyruvyl transferase WcaK-like protein